MTSNRKEPGDRVVLRPGLNTRAAFQEALSQAWGSLRSHD